MTQGDSASAVAPLGASPRRLATAIDAVLAVASLLVMLGWFVGHPIAYAESAPVMSPAHRISTPWKSTMSVPT